MTKHAVDQAYRALERAIRDWCYVEWENTRQSCAEEAAEFIMQALEDDKIHDCMVDYCREWYNEEHQR